MPLNLRQRSHKNRILEQAMRLIDAKYTKGALEHTGAGEPELEDLGAEKLLDCAIEEAVDQLTYLLTLKELKSWPR